VAGHSTTPVGPFRGSGGVRRLFSSPPTGVRIAGLSALASIGTPHAWPRRRNPIRIPRSVRSLDSFSREDETQKAVKVYE